MLAIFRVTIDELLRRLLWSDDPNGANTPVVLRKRETESLKVSTYHI